MKGFTVKKFLVLAFLVAGTAFAQAPTIVKNATQGGAIEFYTNPSGTTTKQGSFLADGTFSLMQGITLASGQTIRADYIKNSAGTDQDRKSVV